MQSVNLEQIKYKALQLLTTDFILKRFPGQIPYPRGFIRSKSVKNPDVDWVIDVKYSQKALFILNYFPKIGSMVLLSHKNKKIFNIFITKTL